MSAESERRGGKSFVDEERARRLQKLSDLEAAGQPRYPPRYDRDHLVDELRDRFGELPAGGRTDAEVRVAGRLMLIRRHGGLVFAKLRDSSGAIQLMVSSAIVGDGPHRSFAALDLGDWVGVRGTVIVSDTGELSIEVAQWQLLTKSLRTQPKDEHGPRDPDTRFRERYLDLIVNPETRRIFGIRSAAIASIRRVLSERGFAEVETPVLDTSVGGAAARPFITHHNALDIDMYMRIALELPLKRLVVGGLERVFEIGRVFRNEGLDTRHNPEFTLLEAYQALADYTEMMELVETLVSTAAVDALGTTKITVDGASVDLAPPWRRVTMFDLVKEQTGAEIHPSMPVAEARRAAAELGVPIEESWGSGKILAEVADERCEATLIEPTFVLDHPRETSPLARPHRDDPSLTERFEVVVGARELANAYSELNDPADQRQRFEAEAAAKAAGDDEAQDLDEDYIRALEYGLPPTGGLGIGLDRLIMLLAEADTIREVILFPTMRPLDSRPGAPTAGAAGLPVPAEMGPPADPDPEPPPSASEENEPAAVSPGPRALLLGWLTGAVAFGSLLPTLPVVSGALGIDPWVGRSGRIAADVISVLVGIALLIVARQLSRGRKPAWRVAILLLGVSAVAHLARGPDPVIVVLDGMMILALIAFRNHFHIPADPRSSLAIARALPAYLFLVAGFGLFSLWIERDALTPSLSLIGGLEATFGGLVGLDGPYTFDSKTFGDFFNAALIALGALGLIGLLYLLFRPLAQRRGPTVEDRERARAIVRRYGSDSLAYFTLHPHKSYFFSSDGKAMIAYAYAGGYALVSADPVGAPGSISTVIEEFLLWCRDRAWRVSFLAAREDNMGLYKEHGFRGVYLGDEAVIDCRRFQLEGGAMKPVREAVRRVEREHSFRLIRETDAEPALIERLNEISRSWREGAEERGFTMELTREVEGREPHFLLALCLDRDERPIGFLRLVPCYGDNPGFSLDLMRRLPDAPNGLTEFLVANSALALGRLGFSRLSLNFAAWGRLFSEDRRLGPAERVQKAIATALNPFFQIESLRDFNEKFQPTWLPRLIIIEDVGQMPRVGFLFASIEGFVELPILERLFVPPPPPPASAKRP